MTIKSSTVQARSAVWLLLAAATFSTSCTREPTPPAGSGKVEEIRGEPISAPVATPLLPEPPPSNGAVVAGPESTAPAAPLPSGAPASEAKPGEPLMLGFEKLASFNYEMPDDINNTNAADTAQSASQIPDTVRALDKKSIGLKGFMLPLKVEGGLVTELLIMRDQSMCCYGTVPKINEWVSVKMTGKGVKPIMDQPVTMFGTLHVGEIRENGYLVGIYHLDGEKMLGPLDM
jgi:hypothetical protein